MQMIANRESPSPLTPVQLSSISSTSLVKVFHPLQTFICPLKLRAQSYLLLTHLSPGAITLIGRLYVKITENK